MSVKYAKFKLPTKIKKDESVYRTNHCRFIAEPLEGGYGNTLGNALRRILLTSIESPGIQSYCIEGIHHEYTAIEGVIEDMTQIGLNFKLARLRKLPLEEQHVSRAPRVVSKLVDITGAMLDGHGGQYVLTLGHLMKDSDFTVVNPDLPLFTVTKPFLRKIDIKIGFGRGYVSAERFATEEKKVDEILLDTSFSPVQLVNYFVENTRVGPHTEYDRLILEVTTDGRISPEEALSFATQIAIVHFQVFEQIKPHAISFDSDAKEVDAVRAALLEKLDLKVSNIELSVRSANCLAGAGIETIGDLITKDADEMLKFRNFGRKSLNEIETKLEEMGLSLGMDLSKFGINRDNIKQVMADYLAHKSEDEKQV